MARKLIDSTQPFEAIYSIYRHEALGCIISAHVVQKLESGRLSLVHQNLLKENFPQFKHELDKIDETIVSLLTEIRPSSILKEFGDKAKNESDFFHNKFQGEIKKHILEYVNRRLSNVMPLIGEKRLYEMGNDGYPAYSRVEMTEDKATVLFHFRKNEKGTLYYPTIKFREEKIEFQFKNAALVCPNPAWLLLNGELFGFKHSLDGNKLKPFLNKKFIIIPPANEEEYYRKFVTSLIEKYHVYAKGFEIETVDAEPKFHLKVKENGGTTLALKLEVDYGRFTLSPSPRDKIKVVMEQNEGFFKFYRVKRQPKIEKEKQAYFEKLSKNKGLLKGEYLEKQEALGWLAANVKRLQAEDIKVEQVAGATPINFHTPKMIMETSESGDWFDIKAIVKIGEFSIPFLKFKGHILNNKRDFKLPDGSIAILPESWFSDYRHLVEIAEERDGDLLSVKKYQAGLLNLDNGKKSPLKAQIENLLKTENYKSEQLPTGVQAELRGYQRIGYDWLNFLNKSKFGGILADDMGLGKTLQTLVLLLREQQRNEKVTSLIVVPTSLVYNWEQECQRFTPGLKMLIHTGINRTKELDKFTEYDLVLSTYGIVRQDIELLKGFNFHYVILDESQMIKNPKSKTNKAVRKLNANNKLSLTGTPMENTLMDLWAQMAFLNPGLLGSENFFKDFYVIPIEKEADEKKQDQLKKILKPFILRRTKEQVASELPPKIEKIHYCEMEKEQREIYEEVKNSYRNYLLDLISTNEDFNRNKFSILAGLQKLRQIALHPQLVEEGNAEMDSGKYQEFLRMLDEVLNKGSKVLVFSQFVKFLTVIRKELDERKIKYAYIDGSVKDRRTQVDNFQTDDSIQVFLISLKAGGVGLNLTAAEYVFIMDPWWNPAVERQAMDRSHRIGQEKTVFVYKFITRDTIEEKILGLQQRKARLSGDIISIEDGDFRKLKREDLVSLLD